MKREIFESTDFQKQLKSLNRSRYLRVAGFWGAFLLAFYGFLALYEVRRPVRLYALGLSALFLFISFVIQELRQKKRFVEVYTHLKRSVGQEALALDFSLVQNPLEALLLAQAQASQAQTRRLVSDQERAKTQMMDYYTLWAHQIKTPIFALQLLLPDIAEEPLRFEIEQQVFRVQEYSEFVLQYLRAESFQDDLHLKSYPLEELVRKSVKKYALQFITKKVSLRLEDLSGFVITDQKWFGFLLDQLLSNALKYTAKGSITLYRQDGWLCIEDTGIGILESDIERVFQRGFTGFNGRLGQDSSGLGLYLCQKISSVLGHSLEMRSKVGQGTQVRIFLKRPTGAVYDKNVR